VDWDHLECPDCRKRFVPKSGKPAEGRPSPATQFCRFQKCKGRPRKPLAEVILKCAPLRATSSTGEDSTHLGIRTACAKFIGGNNLNLVRVVTEVTIEFRLGGMVKLAVRYTRLIRAP